MTNAEPGLLQKVNALSASFFSISPLSIIDDMVLAPMGKPQMIPKIKAQAPPSPTPNSHFTGFESSFPTFAPSPLFTISSEITIKGKREGMTVLAHSFKPFFIYSIAISERMRKSRKIIADVMPKITAVFLWRGLF